MANKKIGIIGLGLIGGSLAKALRFRIGLKNLVAVDSCKDYIDSAIRDGVIENGSTEMEDVLSDCDLVFICTPVKVSIRYIDQLLPLVKPDCILSDVGSTKGEILRYINSLENPPCFVGGHPMAGSEKSGYTSSSAHMFENAYYMLCPSKTATEDSVQLLSNIITVIGAIPVVIDSEEHDRVTGSISHLPHVVASALVNLVQQTDSSDSKMQMLAAGGFKDITRIASSSPEMWENIVLSNKTQVLNILQQYIQVMENFKNELEHENRERIYDFFHTSKVFRDSFSSTKKGLIPSMPELVVDVEDKPGIIGEIATLLGSNAINIKNINITNSREFEQGCLRITLPDEDSADASLELLRKSGYPAAKCC